jgi:alpha-mannosidase
MVVAESDIEVVGDGAALRYRLCIDNQARNHRLRLRLPTGLRRVSALAGAQFGSIRRDPVKAGRPARPEWPVSTAPAHRWVAVANGARGLAVFTPGFFEYEWTHGGDLLITLLRAVGELSRGDLPSRPGHAGWPMATPAAQCLGEETIELGLAPIRESDLGQPGLLEAIWEDLFVSPASRWIRDSTALPVEAAPTIELEGEGLVFSSCVSGDEPGALTLRCFNANTRPVDGAWRFSAPVLRAGQGRADGTMLEQLAVDDADSNRLRFTAGKQAILTFNITLQCASQSSSR